MPIEVYQPNAGPVTPLGGAPTTWEPQPPPNYPEAAEGASQPQETGDPIPQETIPFALTTEIAQFYRMPEGDDEASFEVAGTAPPSTRVSWVLMDSLNEMFEDHTEICDVSVDGLWNTTVYAHGPMDVIRVEFSNVEPEAPPPDPPLEDGPAVLTETPTPPVAPDPLTVIVTQPFDIIAFDAPEPAARTSDELTLRLQRHAKFVEGGLAVPSSPPMPFQVLPLDDSVDVRIRMAREFAQRALSSGSIIDVAKALLLMIDESIYEIGDSDVASDALAGKPPSLLV